MTKIDDALVERMVKLVRDLHADHVEHNMHDRVQDFVARTAAIVAELPEPVDPDLIEARKLVAKRYNRETSSDAILETLLGDDDDTDAVRNCVAAIKRGRELERLFRTGRE